MEHNIRSFGDISKLVAEGRLAARPQEIRKAKGQRINSADIGNVLISLGYDFRLNTLSRQVEINGEPLSDGQEAWILTQLRDAGATNSRQNAETINAIAWKNRYNPIEQFLDCLIWDGKDYIAELGEYIRGDCDLFVALMRRFLVGAVEKFHNKNEGRNIVPVFSGGQEIGKSYLVRWLAGGLKELGGFTDGPVDPGDKSHRIRLAKTLLWEIEELGQVVRKKDRDAIKSFLTATQFQERKVYGRRDEIYYAICSFIATGNPDVGFFADPTGSTRFFVLNISGIDWGYSDAIDPDQLWAQAYAAWKRGERGRLSKELRDKRLEQNELHTLDDPYVSAILDIFQITSDAQDIVDSLKLQEAVVHRLGGLRVDKSESTQVGLACVKLNIEKKRVMKDGKQVRVYMGLVRK